MLNLDNFYHLSTRGMYKNSKMIVKNSALQAGRNKKRE